MSTHVLSLLVEDKPGLLTRVAGLFARRGFNIESLAVGASELEARFGSARPHVDQGENRCLNALAGA